MSKRKQSSILTQRPSKTASEPQERPAPKAPKVLHENKNKTLTRRLQKLRIENLKRSILKNADKLCSARPNPRKKLPLVNQYKHSKLPVFAEDEIERKALESIIDAEPELKTEPTYEFDVSEPTTSAKHVGSEIFVLDEDEESESEAIIWNEPEPATVENDASRKIYLLGKRVSCRICMLCLKAAPILTSVFKHRNQLEKIDIMIASFDKRIKFDPTAAQDICNICLETVMDFYELKTKNTKNSRSLFKRKAEQVGFFQLCRVCQESSRSLKLIHGNATIMYQIRLFGPFYDKIQKGKICKNCSQILGSFYHLKNFFDEFIKAGISEVLEVVHRSKEIENIPTPKEPESSSEQPFKVGYEKFKCTFGNCNRSFYHESMLEEHSKSVHSLRSYLSKVQKTKLLRPQLPPSALLKPVSPLQRPSKIKITAKRSISHFESPTSSGSVEIVSSQSEMFVINVIEPHEIKTEPHELKLEEDDIGFDNGTSITKKVRTIKKSRPPTFFVNSNKSSDFRK